MAFLFDEATAVVPAGPEAPEAGQRWWQAELRDEMSIVNGHPNGGYLLAVMARAAVEAAGQEGRHVIAATCSYVAAPAVGPAQVMTEVLRRGRTASQVRARLVQEGSARVEALLTVADLGDAQPTWGDVRPVEMPSEEECLAAAGERRLVPPGMAEPPLSQVLSRAFDPATLGFVSGEPSGEGELRAWVRFAGGRPVDPLALLLAVDALPPATFEVALTGWVPTLSLTAYVRALPGPGPLRVRFRAGEIVGGMVDETCEVWDSAGRLVAQSTQLAAIRMP